MQQGQKTETDQAWILPPPGGRPIMVPGMHWVTLLLMVTLVYAFLLSLLDPQLEALRQW